jgi:hypothetical protein
VFFNFIQPLALLKKKKKMEIENEKFFVFFQKDESEKKLENLIESKETKTLNEKLDVSSLPNLVYDISQKTVIEEQNSEKINRELKVENILTPETAEKSYSFLVIIFLGAWFIFFFFNLKN